MNTTPHFREFAKYVSLNVLGMIALSCYILADTFFVAQGMGADGLTALNLAIPIYNFIHGTGLMIGMGGGTKYSIAKSQGDSSAANRTFTHAVLLTAGFAAFFVLVGLFFTDNILTWFGASGQVFTMSNTYLRVLMFYAPAFLLNNVLLCFVRNDGAPQLSMTAMIIGSLSNVVLDWVFIFPCGMGMFGAAFATGLSPILGLLILSSHFFTKRNGFTLVPHRPEAKRCLDILSCGAPSLVTEASSGIVIIVFNSLLMGLQGNVGVAAYGVIANLSLVVIAIFTGIAQGIQPLLSRSYGAGDRSSATTYFRYALLTMLLVSAAVYAAVFFGANPITSLFNSEQNAQLQAIAAQGLRLYFTACPFAGFTIILSIYFTSTDRPRPAHILSLLRGFIVILPMAFLLAWAAQMTGIWCAFPATELLVAAIGLVFYKMRARF